MELNPTKTITIKPQHGWFSDIELELTYDSQDKAIKRIWRDTNNNMIEVDLNSTSKNLNIEDLQRCFEFISTEPADADALISHIIMSMLDTPIPAGITMAEYQIKDAGHGYRNLSDQTEDLEDIHTLKTYEDVFNIIGYEEMLPLATIDTNCRLIEAAYPVGTYPDSVRLELKVQDNKIVFGYWR